MTRNSKSSGLVGKATRLEQAKISPEHFTPIVTQTFLNGYPVLTNPHSFITRQAKLLKGSRLGAAKRSPIWPTSTDATYADSGRHALASICYMRLSRVAAARVGGWCGGTCRSPKVGCIPHHRRTYHRPETKPGPHRHIHHLRDYPPETPLSLD